MPGCHHSTLWRRVGQLACAAGLAGGLALATPPRAEAALITVTTTADELRSDGDCALREAVRAANLNQRVDRCPAGRRDAVDVIRLPAATFTLAIAGAGEDNATRGDLDLRGKIQLVGAGAGATVLDGAGLDRLIDVRGGAVVTISGVTIRNAGHESGAVRNLGTLNLERSVVRENRGEKRGAGIWNDNVMRISASAVSANVGDDAGGIFNNGYMAITGSTISDNRGYPRGGGIFNSARGNLVIGEQSVVRNNQSVGDGEGLGGGIFNDGGRLTLSDSTVSENLADYGGGIYSGANGRVSLNNAYVNRNMVTGVGTALEHIPDSSGAGILSFGALTVSGGTLNDNRYDWEPRSSGGGLANFGRAILVGATVARNGAAGDGGGIYNGGTMALERSIVRGNTAGRPQEDGYWLRDGLGGGLANPGELTIVGSIIAENDAASAGGVFSGGQLVVRGSTVRDNLAGATAGIENSGTLTIEGSQISGNRSSDQTGGIGNSGTLTLSSSTIRGNKAYDGAGITNYGRATLTNVTISGNQGYDVAPAIMNGGTLLLASSTIAGNYFSPDLFGTVRNEGLFVLRNSVVATTSDASIGARSCEGQLSSEGYNLVQTFSEEECAVVGDPTGNLIGVDPRLGPLRNNGGPTLSHAPLRGSPLIDAGSPARPGSGGSACPALDQRGYTRPRDGDGDGAARCDIGAVERQSVGLSAWGESDMADAPDPASEPDPADFVDEGAPAAPDLAPMIFLPAVQGAQPAE